MSYLYYHAQAKITLFIVIRLQMPYNKRGERVRLRRNKVALRNLRNNSWSTVHCPKALFLANVQIVTNLNSASGFSEGVNCFCAQFSRFTTSTRSTLSFAVVNFTSLEPHSNRISIMVHRLMSTRYKKRN